MLSTFNLVRDDAFKTRLLKGKALFAYNSELFKESKRAQTYWITMDFGQKTHRIGFIAFYIVAEEIFVDYIDIDERLQRKNIGSTIVSWMKALCVLFNKRIRLYSSPQAEGYWKKMNFQETEVTVSHEGNKEYIWSYD